MGHARAVQMMNNVSTVAASSAVYWEGGRSVLMVEGDTFPTTLILQIKSRSNTWVDVGSNITADGLSAGMDLPAGTYRINAVTGTIAGMYIDLCRVMQ